MTLRNLNTIVADVHCFAIRRVNPFRGVMQIIETAEGRALSCNGIVWEILVRAIQTGRLADEEDKKYYRFGLWSQDAGLMKRSNSPVDGQDYFELASRCDVLISHVQEHYDQLPFTIEDHRELWLFDEADTKPIALLSTTVPEHHLSSAEPKAWLACTGDKGTASQRRFPQSDMLEAWVKRRAGNVSNRHWVSRSTCGDGVIEKTGESIQVEQFPVLLLIEDWESDETHQCVNDYFRWISPSLLTLQHLDRETRARIESNLHIQAVSIEHHWHLFPEIIDQTLLNAARVQCEIEQSH